jgi:serine/threonine protein kinase/tetratricopeptide (TPR) repeat protein
MADFVSNLIAGHERHILAQLIADDEMQEAGLDGIIGPYRLAECLGEGGFGFVWRAEQTEPVRREVALKVLKRGMDTAQVLARFSLEQQALASMEHPHIAALLDAGATRDGRPFFVMELVRGPPLTSYCREKNLPWQQRVALFKDVCGGVLHAHQKGMIHRDLKPSNILVAEVDGKPVPKIIDFGIAKAMTEGFAQEELFTLAGHVMGTPLYMSPEQLSGSRDVDVRSDVYALGVLFYQMLTGSLPYQSLMRENTTHAEMLRVIHEKRPVRPSVQMTETVKLATRHEKGAKLRLSMSGIPADLDWIILKALEQDRDRRYDSVGALIADVERFQSNQPVLAHPPSFGYLTGRWMRRNRLVFAAACISLAAIIGGAGVALWQAHEARVAQGLAEIEAARAQQAVGFLTTMLDRVAAEIANGRNPEALQLALENSHEEIQKLSHDPALQAELFKRVGGLYDTIGERKHTLPLLKAQFEVLGKIHGPDSQKAWDAELSYLTKVVDHGARSSAPPLIEDLLRRLENKDQRHTAFWFMVKRQFVRAWTKLRQPKSATAAAREVLQELAEHGAPVATMISVKSACLDAFKEAGDYTKAESLAEECLQLSQDDSTNQRRAWVEDRYLWLIRAKGDHRRGVEWLTERMTQLHKSSGADPMALIKLLLELSRFEFDAGQRAEAIQHAGEAYSIARKIAPQDEIAASKESIQTAREQLVDALCDLAGYESNTGMHEVAIRHAREAFRVADEQGHINRLEDSLLVLAQAHERAGDLESAFESYRLRYERVGQRGANYLRWHEDLQFMCVTRLKQNRTDDAMTLAHELWKKENSSKEARQDKAHLADIAKLALRCHDALKKCYPGTAEPAEYPAWKAAATPAR